MATPGFNFSLIVIITTLFSRSLSQAVCGTGWFGTGCKYKCGCRSNKCQSNGECVSGTFCLPGWFGPSCQYRNRMYLTRSNPSWIKDEVIRTCNPGTPIITVDFAEYYYFTWLRVVYNRTALGTYSPRPVYFYFKDISNDTVDCTFKRVFTVDHSAVDIHCNLSKRINQITFRGNEVLKICELFVDGGRNLALKQRTTQSSTHWGFGFGFSSSLAVDGSRDANFDRKTCTHTVTGDKNPTWFLQYPRSAIISRAVLYNRDIVQSRLQGFIFKMFDASGKQVQYYKEPGLAKLIYQITFTNLAAVDTISVQSHTSLLTLCEVETYGEFICPTLKWGLDCFNDCLCTPSELCSPITGKCNVGCSPGLYGLLCEIKCPTNCLNKECFRDTGVCVACEKGYMGHYCDIECWPHKYGIDCRLTCPIGCSKRSCNNSAIATGNDCSDRLCDYDGLCNACNDTALHGGNCTMECPTNCLFKICDSKDGACHSCQTGFYGKNCSQACSENCKDSCDFESADCFDCKKTFYGNDCALECPITCIERACHATNGTCSERCRNGFYGETCSHNCPNMCKDHICDETNGICIEGCKTGVFGTDCTHLCPLACFNSICEFTNGSCYTCDLGYYGVFCDRPCLEDCKSNTCDIHSGLCSEVADTDYHVEVVALSAVVALLLMTTVVLWKRKRVTAPEEQTIRRLPLTFPSHEIRDKSEEKKDASLPLVYGQL